jgi:RHS repeat-associated protein
VLTSCVGFNIQAVIIGGQEVCFTAGNRIKTGGTFARTNLPPALASASYNANNQQTTFGTMTETYDLNGNLATSTDAGVTTTYTWNARNQLTGISKTGLTASFTYDSFGRRTGRTVNGVVTNYVYDGLNPVQEKNGATVTANLLTGLEIDEFFIRTDGVGVRALLPDALGSTVALGDGTGTLQTQYTYEPFGVTTQTGAASTNSYKFTGREDDGTGLYYYRARYYPPQLQRFIAEDPIGFRGGDSNVYVYVNNNPANLTDPTGEIVPQLIGCAIGAGAAIGVDKLSGRKVNLIDAGLGCAIGALGGFIYSNSFKFAVHDPHHYFPLFGRNLPHIQMNWWQPRVSGSGGAFRIPISPSMYRLLGK